MRFLPTPPANPLAYAALTIDSRGKHTMNSPGRNERIAIEGMIECHNAAGDRWRVLRWRRQVEAGATGEPVRWESTGPAVFTLLDASAVIQISGSALQIVANGMVLNVVDHLDVLPGPADDDLRPRSQARRRPRR